MKDFMLQVKMFLISLLSRKFLIFVLATIFKLYKIIDDNTWLIVVGIYLGANTAEAVLPNIIKDKDK